MKKITSDDIEKELNKFFEDRAKAPFIKRYEWEENGKKYSSWKINTRSSIFNCGDVGMELFLKAFREEFKKQLK